MSDNEGSAHEEEAPSPAPSIEHEPSASEAEEEEEIAEIADDHNNEGDRGDIEMGIVETGRRSRKSSSSSSSSSSKSSHKKHKKHKRVIHRGGGNVKGGCWIVCIMIVAFLSIGGFMIYKFFADTSFSFSSSSFKSKNVVSTWSGDFTGEYTADVFSGEWSAKSDTRSMFSLAYRLAESEHKISIEKGPRPFDSYTVYTADRIGSNKNSFAFSVGVPFTKSRPQDNASVLATIKIKGSEWKEKHEGRPKVEIKREFTDSAMKVTYTVDKAVYTKRFEKD